jgi:hypothetical protein
MTDLTNMLKINITLIGTTTNNGEGVWAEFVSPEDKVIYEDETQKGTTFNVMLRNHPFTTDKLSWGDTVAVVNNGKLRPSLLQRV